MFDDVLTLLLLAVLVRAPFFLAALALAWLTHEWVLYGGARLRGRALLTRRFWTKDVWDHPPRFFLSYFLLFIGYLNLLDFPLWYATNATNLTSWGFLVVSAYVLFGAGLVSLGYLILRVRASPRMA